MRGDLSPEDVVRLIASGENERVEFKRTASRQLAEEICAMANAQGGWILFGVDDHGRILGVDRKHVMDRVSQALQTLPVRPETRLTTHTIDGKTIVILTIKPLAKGICTVGGIAYIRIATAKRALNLEELMSMLSEKGMLSADRLLTPVPARRAEKKLIRQFIRDREKRGLSPQDPDRLLKSLHAVEKGFLTLAGLYFFTSKPQDVYPHLAVRLIHDQEDYRFTGPLPQLVEDILKTLLTRIPRVTLSREARRREQPVFSPRALREALVNALVHRNYGILAEVRVTLTPQELRIRNPGSFPPGSSPQDPQPVPRNPILYELAFQAGLVERIGSGIPLIYREARENPLFTVEYVLHAQATEIIFRRTFNELREEERRILSILGREALSASRLARELGVSTPTVLSMLHHLETLGYVQREGKGRSTRWKLSQYS